MKQIVKVWMLAVAMTAIMVLAGGCSRAATVIKLEDYYTISFSGYDGEGKAEITENGLGEAVREALLKNGTIKSLDPSEILRAMNSNKALAALQNCLISQDFCSLNKEEGLSNGDEVVLTFRYDNEAFKETHIQLEGKQLVFKVSGLEEIKLFDAFEKIKIEWTGYSTLAEAVLKEVPDNGLTYTVSENKHLKNGDSVTVTVSYGGYSINDYARRYGKKPAALSKTFEVSGLPELKTVDIFEGLEVYYTGVAPFASAEIGKLPPYKVNYSLKQERDSLKNGSEVTVVAIPVFADWDVFAREYGILPEATEKTITVEGLTEFVSSLEQINEEGWAKLRKEMEDRYAEHFRYTGSSYYYSPSFDNVGYGMTAKQIEEKYFRNFKWEKAILLSAKGGERMWGEAQNRLYIVYSCDVLDGPDQKWKGADGNVGAFYINDVMVEADGTLTLPTEEFQFTHAVQGEDRFENDNLLPKRGKYEITETPLNWQ